MQPEGVVLDEPPVVGIALSRNQPDQSVEESRRQPERRKDRVFQRPHQVEVVERGERNVLLGVKPALPAMTRRINSEIGEQAENEAVMAVLKLFEIAAHVVSAPGWISGELSYAVPIFIAGIDHDHRVMRRATAETTGARIENAVLLSDEFLVALLPFLTFVMPHKKVPLHAAVLARASVEDGNPIVIGETLFVWVSGVSRLHRQRVPARFQNQHLAAGFREARCHRAAAGAGPHDHIFEGGVVSDTHG